MLYNVASGFVKIDETQGIIQNASSGNSIEVSSQNTADSGIILKPGESLSFTDTDIYVRTIGNKNSSVRVVPFVDGFSLGKSSSDFDVRKYESTGILIYSKDAGGNLVEKPIHCVNPESTNAQLVEFGKSIVAATPNTYEATYRVTKELCDINLDKYLIVDSPFTQDFTDNCANTWSASGSPTISDNSLQLSGGSYLRCNNITFGAQDFSICGWCFFNSSSTGYARIFEMVQAEKQQANQFVLFRQNDTTFTVGHGTSYKNVAALWNSRFHFALVYEHDKAILKLYLNGELKATLENQTVNRIARIILLGRSFWNDGTFNGSISQFQIYDGVALYPD